MALLFSAVSAGRVDVNCAQADAGPQQGCFSCPVTRTASMGTPWVMQTARPTDNLAYQMAVYKTHDGVSDKIQRTGQWEPLLTRTVVHELKKNPKAVLLDIGANIGWFSLLGASLGASVTSFEPNPMNRFLIEQSICALKSRLDGSLRLLPYGAGRKHQKCSMISPGSNLGDTMLVCGDIQAQVKWWNEWGAPRGFAYEVRGEPIEVRRADALVKQHVDIVKMDIEGFEPEALRGLTKIFEQRPPPRLVISEFQPSVMRSNGFDPAHFLLYFSSRGYSISVAPPTARDYEGVKPVGRTEKQAVRWLNRTAWSRSYDLIMRYQRAKEVR